MGVKEILLILLVILMVIFSIQNIQPVGIQFLFWKVSVPAVLTIGICFLIGFLTGWFFRWSRGERKRIGASDDDKPFGSISETRKGG